MLTVWKYKLEDAATQVLTIPGLRRVLSVQTQHGYPVLWALVDLKRKPVQHKVRIYSTGARIDEREIVDHTFVGTYQMSGGSTVHHVFLHEGDEEFDDLPGECGGVDRGEGE